jgi:hypothetical protein
MVLAGGRAHTQQGNLRSDILKSQFAINRTYSAGAISRRGSSQQPSRTVTAAVNMVLEGSDRSSPPARRRRRDPAALQRRQRVGTNAGCTDRPRRGRRRRQPRPVARHRCRRPGAAVYRAEGRRRRDRRPANRQAGGRSEQPIDAQGNVSRVLPKGQSSGKVVAGWLPAGARLAMAFGTMSADLFQSSANRSPEPAVLFYATDDDRQVPKGTDSGIEDEVAAATTCEHPGSLMAYRCVPRSDRRVHSASCRNPPQRRLAGFDDAVLSLCAKGMTTGRHRRPSRRCRRHGQGPQARPVTFDYLMQPSDPR